MAINYKKVYQTSQVEIPESYQCDVCLEVCEKDKSLTYIDMYTSDGPLHLGDIKVEHLCEFCTDKILELLKYWAYRPNRHLSIRHCFKEL